MLIFRAVGNTRTFTQAAEALKLPLSKVSRAITSLEMAAKLQLVRRSGGFVHLTDAGREYLAACERALLAYGDAVNVLTTHREEAAGSLHVGVPVLFARHVLAPLLPRFRALCPRVHIEMVLYSDWDQEPSANHDLFIKVKTPKDSGYFLKGFPPIRQGIFAAPKYLASKPEIRAPEDLLAHRCIGYSPESGMVPWKGSYRGEQIFLKPQFDTVAGDVEIQSLLAEQGMGIAVLPLWFAHSSVAGGKLTRVLPDFEPNPVVFYALHAGKTRMAAKEKAFLEFLEDVLVTEEDPRMQGRPRSEFFLLDCLQFSQGRVAAHNLCTEQISTPRRDRVLEDRLALMKTSPTKGGTPRASGRRSEFATNRSDSTGF